MKGHPDKPTLEDLHSADPQTIANRTGIPVLWCDHQVTRRQKLHGCNLPCGGPPYSSSHLNECLAHLDREGYTYAYLICETPRLKHLACYIEFFDIEPGNPNQDQLPNLPTKPQKWDPTENPDLPPTQAKGHPKKTAHKPSSKAEKPDTRAKTSKHPPAGPPTAKSLRRAYHQA